MRTGRRRYSRNSPTNGEFYIFRDWGMKHLVLAITVLCLLASAGYGEETRTYTNPHFHYTIGYPESWEVTAMREGAVAFKAPSEGPGDDIIENVSVKVFDFRAYGPQSLEQWQTIEIVNLKVTMPGFSLLEKGMATIGERDAAYLIYNTKQRGRSINLKQYFFLVESYGYVLTYVAAEDTFAIYLQPAEDIIQSIRVE
jgi:hypothetical protein